MATRNVVLTDAKPEMIVRLVATGRCQNASEAFKAGLRLLERELDQIEALRTRLSLSLEDARRGGLAEGSGEAAMAGPLQTRENGADG